MTQKIPIKCLVSSNDIAFSNNLKSVLFSQGLRDTSSLYSSHEIKTTVLANHWPIIFVDSTGGYDSSLVNFSKVTSIHGAEFLPIFLVMPENKMIQVENASRIGAAGILAKPINQISLSNQLKPYLNAGTEQMLLVTLHITKLIFRKDYREAMQWIEKIEKVPKLTLQCQTAMARIEYALGEYIASETRLGRIIRSQEFDVYARYELASFYQKIGRHADALNSYQAVFQKDPHLAFKIWDHVNLLIELDEIEEAAELTDFLCQNSDTPERAIEIMLRLLTMIGAEKFAVSFSKKGSEITKKYMDFVKSKESINA